MAWTWSAQGRGNFAFKPAIDAHALSRRLRPRSIDAAKRWTFAAAAAGLTLGGLIIPVLPAETLSSLLFLGGAFVALLALRPPFDTASPAPAASIPAMASVPSTVCKANRDVRFVELIARPDRAAALDRAAWARLTAHMSHELRTPLNAVLGFSELMSKEVFGPMGASCYSDYARDIHASGRMLLKSAEDALAITALLTAAPGKDALPTSMLSASANEALAFHAGAIAERGVTLTACFCEDDMIVADAQTVRQLLINLVAEMLERAASGAAIDISTSLAGDQLQIAVTLHNAVAPAIADVSFNMQLARTLAELSGARMLELGPADGAIETIVQFAPAAQRDFFAAA